MSCEKNKDYEAQEFRIFVQILPRSQLFKKLPLHMGPKGFYRSLQIHSCSSYPQPVQSNSHRRKYKLWVFFLWKNYKLLNLQQ